MRTVVRADYKPKDTVPILSTPVVHIFGSDIASLNKMSRLERFFEHAWYLFASSITGFVSFVGFLLAFSSEVYAKLGVFGMVAFVLLWLFSIIQFLSFVSYFRWRIRH